MRSVVTWARTVAVAAALIGGCLGSAGAVRLSGFPGPPGTDEAVAAAVTAIGQRPADRPGPVVVCRFFCPDYDGDPVVAYDAEPDHTDVVVVTYDLPGTASSVEGAARLRLAAAGWRADPDGTFSRDGQVVLLQIGDTAGGVRAMVLVSKATSAPAVVLAVAGALLGGTAGWLGARAAYRRFRRHGPAVSLVAGMLAVLVTAVTMGYATVAVLLVVSGGPQQPGVLLADFLLTFFPHLTTVVAVAALAALLLIAFPPRRGRLDPVPGPPVGHTGGHGAARSRPGQLPADRPE